MPNWVHTEMSVTGPAKYVERFKLRAAWSHMEYWPDMAPAMSESVLSFWNFKRPEWVERMEGGSYWARETSHNWYTWNTKNWGTKWDAANAELIVNADTDIVYRFDTAWSPPEAVFKAMAAQFPKCMFEMRCVEETGWGVEYAAKNGTLEETESWNTPESHADWVKIDREHQCPCDWSSDGTDWYEDCPRAKPLTEEEHRILESIIESF